MTVDITQCAAVDGYAFASAFYDLDLDRLVSKYNQIIFLPSAPKL